MKTLNSFNAFYKQLEKVKRNYAIYEKKAALFSAEALKIEAQAKIGHLQGGVGRYPSSGGAVGQWAELAESTKEDKERQGYVFNADYNPLYREGDLKKSISAIAVTISGKTKIVLGSDSQIMFWQEFGTEKIPPRSVIGLTMFQYAPKITYYFGEMLVKWISNQPLNLKRLKNGSV